MKSVRNIERLVRRLKVPIDGSTRRRVLSDAIRAIERLQQPAHRQRDVRLLFGPVATAHLLKMVGVAALVTVTVMAAQYLLFLLQLRLEYPYSF